MGRQKYREVEWDRKGALGRAEARSRAAAKSVAFAAFDDHSEQGRVGLAEAWQRREQGQKLVATTLLGCCSLSLAQRPRRPSWWGLWSVLWRLEWQWRTHGASETWR